MKKILSFLLTFVMLLSLCSVTAFAEDNSFMRAKINLTGYLNSVEWSYIYRIWQPNQYPIFSDESLQRVIEVDGKIRSEIDTYTTVEEVDEAMALIEAAVAQLDFDEEELAFILDLMEADYKDTTYYDAETSAEIKEIYETAQAAYESKDPKAMNESYVALRAELDKLCMTVTVAGDVNNDGEFTIKDVTLIQKYLADSVQLTSAQRFAGVLENPYCKVGIATQFMKALAAPDNAEDQKVYKYSKYCISRLTSIHTPNPSEFGEFTSDGCNEYYAKNRYGGFWFFD